ncbi:hypothetical protein KIPB_006589 [Kipferlia bialata]|uniref:Uncharacterized protein n=1 Tax=Kipferlia bialata TaxID=797122 RepID=A0A9K3GJC9_9EUKA|nr:hypothetical protein KIPB_006589 [Kipferlia bialata]|eukprot:g6589.t1
MKWEDDAETLFWLRVASWVSAALYGTIIGLTIHRRSYLNRSVFVCLLIFLVLRTGTWLAHGIDVFVGLPNIMKHALFLVPLGPLFSVFSAIAVALFAVAKMRPRQGTFRSFQVISNIIIYGIIIASIVAYVVLGDTDLKTDVIGITNLVLSSIMLLLGTFIAIYAWRAAVKINKYSLNKSMARVVSYRLVVSTLAAAVGFLGYSTGLVIEGIYFIAEGGFMHSFNAEFTQTPPIETLYTVLQALCCLSAVYRRSSPP